MKLYSYTAERSLPRIAVKGLPGGDYGGGFPWWPDLVDAVYHAEMNPEEEETRKGKWKPVPMVILEIDTKQTGEIYGVTWDDASAYWDMIRHERGEKKAIAFQRGLEKARTAAQFLKLVDNVDNFVPIKPKNITVLGFPPEEWDFDKPVKFAVAPKPVVSWKQPLITRLLRSIFLPKHKLYGKGAGARMGQVEAVAVGEADVEEPQIIEDVELVWAAGKKFPRGLRGAFGRETGDAMIALIEEQIGERPGKLLGAGKRGAAYRLPSGRVLKITMDAREMKASSRMLGVIHPNLARVWQAFIVRANGKGVGIVVRDAIDKPLDRYDKKLSAELDEILNRQVEGIAEELAHDPNVDEERLYAESMGGAIFELRAQSCDTVEPQGTRMMDIADAYRELEYLGIVGLDFGGQNFGIVKKPKPRVVLFDYGMAFVSGEQDVPVLALPVVEEVEAA